MAKKTTLFKIHKACWARMVDFAGWDMPVFYTGIIEEHHAVRKKAGLFDVSHMGEIEIQGKGAIPTIQKLLVSNIEMLSVSQVKYSAMCYPEGGVVDDVTVYRLPGDRFLLCTNASNTEKDYDWISQNMEEETIVINRSADYAQLAIQGPRSIEVLQKLTPFNLQEIKYYCFAQSELCGVESIISRTGYSGEDGFELYFSPDFAINIWESLMTEGKVCGLQPVGMGARDTLRLEMGFPLYGHELNETTTLLEAGLGRLIDFSKPHFIGKEILLNQKTDGIQRKLVGFQMLGERIPRSKYEIYKNIKKVGIVTSGTMSPTFQRGVGLGYVRVEEAWEGNEISIMIRQKALPAAIVKIPFINRFADISEKKGGARHGVTRQAS